jgi:hypothetical protein
MVGDKKEPIYEVRIATLTKSETTMTVHFGKGRSNKSPLVNSEQPAENTKTYGAAGCCYKLTLLSDM